MTKARRRLWRPTPTPLQRAAADAIAALQTMIECAEVIAEFGAESRRAIDTLDSIYRSPEGSVYRLLRLAREAGHSPPTQKDATS
jgi:hypothetical protein